MDDQEWELCLLNVTLEPLYIHKEGVVDYIGDRVGDRVKVGNWDSSKTVTRPIQVDRFGIFQQHYNSILLNNNTDI